MTSEQIEDIKRVVIDMAFSEEEVQQRVDDARIVLALGWTWAPDKSHDGRVMDWNTWYDDEGAQRGRYDHPRYHESLDACATAEARLTGEQRGKYAIALDRVLHTDQTRSFDETWWVRVTATAQQRAAALLAVLKGGK